MAAVISASTEWVESVSQLKLPPRANKRLQELMDRNTEGKLREAEREEMATLVEMSETISLVRAKALHLSGRTPE